VLCDLATGYDHCLGFSVQILHSGSSQKIHQKIKGLLDHQRSSTEFAVVNVHIKCVSVRDADSFDQ
jgi:hypothetical protein